ncbi:Cse1-domain-containing protein [Athelia psychrophila]|uniref:Cse1-domain-containing protein n=1 Tax=Athelia psychrophila TaxID=1759441 RepID=A0A166BH74_9AGAM|nr:Cse1-domain-containing protein [Fibularhizoctonia sp. CBS 109695]
MTLLLETYYDFMWQELPPAIEDAHEEFWRAREGGVMSVCKTRVLEIVEIVSQTLRFTSTATRSGYYNDIFGLEETIEGLALVVSGYEAEVTEIVGKCFREGLTTYHGAKGRVGTEGEGQCGVSADGGRYAQRDDTHGVTSTNSLVDIAEFFLDHAFEDLQAEAGTVEPVLQVDAIGYLYNFRSQLTKYQLLSMLPLLVRHLGLANNVCYIYDQPGALHQEAPVSAIHDQWSLFGKRAEEVARLGFLNATTFPLDCCAVVYFVPVLFAGLVFASAVLLILQILPNGTVLE